MKKFLNVLGDVGYALETAFMLAFFSSLAVWFYVRYWPKEPPIIIEDDADDNDFSYYVDPETNIVYMPEYININTASLRELQELDEIGESKAKAIIEYRTKNGNFTSIEQITEVNGISENIFKKIREKITV